MGSAEGHKVSGWRMPAKRQLINVLSLLRLTSALIRVPVSVNFVSRFSPRSKSDHVVLPVRRVKPPTDAGDTEPDRYGSHGASWQCRKQKDGSCSFPSAPVLTKVLEGTDGLNASMGRQNASSAETRRGHERLDPPRRISYGTKDGEKRSRLEEDVHACRSRAHISTAGLLEYFEGTRKVTAGEIVSLTHVRRPPSRHRKALPCAGESSKERGKHSFFSRHVRLVGITSGP